MSKDKIIVEAGKESFPASDPVAWTLGADHAVNFSEDHRLTDITQMLAYEHRQIKQVLIQIEQLLKELQDKKNTSIETVKSLTDFFLIFVENFHHKKEEIIFKLFKSSDDHSSLSLYLLNDLQKEHEYGKLILAKLSKSFTINALKDLYDFHLNHMAKEDEYVLPVINRLIDKQTQKELLLQFVELKKKIGEDEYTRMIKLAELG